MSATLKAQIREKVGSRSSRKLRAEGRLPVNLVGESKEPLHLSIEERPFLTARRHHEHLFDLEYDGGNEAAVVHELQWDAMGERIVHVEFQRVVRGRKMVSEVELKFIGHPKGILNHLMTHVSLETLPSQIPDEIEVKVDGLEPGFHIKAKDLVLPEGASLAVEPDADVAVISAAGAGEPEEDGDEEGEGAAPAE